MSRKAGGYFGDDGEDDEEEEDEDDKDDKDPDEDPEPPEPGDLPEPINDGDSIEPDFGWPKGLNRGLTYTDPEGGILSLKGGVGARSMQFHNYESAVQYLKSVFITTGFLSQATWRSNNGKVINLSITLDGSVTSHVTRGQLLDLTDEQDSWNDPTPESDGTKTNGNFGDDQLTTDQASQPTQVKEEFSVSDRAEFTFTNFSNSVNSNSQAWSAAVTAAANEAASSIAKTTFGGQPGSIYQYGSIQILQEDGTWKTYTDYLQLPDQYKEYVDNYLADLNNPGSARQMAYIQSRTGGLTSITMIEGHLANLGQQVANTQSELILIQDLNVDQLVVDLFYPAQNEFSDFYSGQEIQSTGAQSLIDVNTIELPFSSGDLFYTATSLDDSSSDSSWAEDWDGDDNGLSSWNDSLVGEDIAADESS